jgi:hypothetical protein
MVNEGSTKNREEIDELVTKVLTDRGSTEDTENKAAPQVDGIIEDPVQTILRDIRFEVADLKVWTRNRLHRFEFLAIFLVMFVAIYVAMLTSGIEIWLAQWTYVVHVENGFLLSFWDWLWISFIAFILALFNTIVIALVLRFSDVRRYLGEVVDWMMEEKPQKKA